MTNYGYARVSTDKQRLDLQRDALLSSGVQIENVIEEIESGAKVRPLFDDLIGRLADGDKLVVWHVDRLGRSALELHRVAQHLRDRGVGLVVTTLGIDTTTPTGKLIYGIVAQLAELERDRLIERTNAGLASARARGQILGRRYALTPHQRKIAFQMHSDGCSYRQIADHFNVSRSAAYRAVRLTQSQQANKPS